MKRSNMWYIFQYMVHTMVGIITFIVQLVNSLDGIFQNLVALPVLCHVIFPSVIFINP